MKIFLTAVKRLSVLAMIVIAAHPATAGNSCSAVFEEATIATPLKAQRFAPESSEIHDPQIRKLSDELSDPYSMAHFLVAEKGDAGARRDLATLEKVLSQETNRKAALDQWVTSESHALVLYSVLHSRGLARESGTLEWLLENNVYFVDAHPLRGPPLSLVSYSFEKEGHDGDISFFYKDPRFADEDWFALGERDRLERLQKLTDKKRVFMPSWKVAPTAFHPEYLSGYSEDVFIEKLRSHTWEIKHKGYEISSDRLMKQIVETTEMFKDTSAVHVHVVFEIENNDSTGEKFGLWTKQKNDHFTLRGMEEGLHNNHRTRLQGAAGGILKRGWDWLRSGGTQTTAPSDFKAIGSRNYKFFSMGVRADIYGPGSTPIRRKIGLELRDVTRKMDVLKADVLAMTGEVQQRVWEKFPAVDPAFDRGLSTDRSRAVKLLEQAVSPEIAKLFRDVAETAALPLESFETGRYVNLSTGDLEGVSPEISERIVSARATYIRELKALEKEIYSFRKRGEKVEPEEIEIALKMTLAEWAAVAKASELFNKK